ncbi:MAG: AraC family transcriptional regulator [Caulobacterales bacterium 32-69-10]|nr:MAG: AraC family transcriptional regulator [Caulobacterales bacterium 32-69-10]
MLVAIYLPAENAHALEFAGVQDVLLEANRQLGRQAYQLPLLSERAGPVTCASGLKILPDAAIDAFDSPIDTLIVSGTYGLPPPSPGVAEWIRRKAPTCRRFGSVCTGAFFLGAAGLLDGHRVTTHWEYAEDLADAYPLARVEADKIFVRNGAMFSSAGTTAALDLTLALIEEDHGPALALAVARRLVMFLKRPGGQSQYSAYLASQVGALSPIARIQAWIRDNEREDLSVAALAKRAAMSERNFARAFVQETGLTPAEFVELTRIDAARRLLDGSGLSLQRVATSSGFSSTQAMRRAFNRRLEVIPSEYRERFRSTG